MTCPRSQSTKARQGGKQGIYAKTGGATGQWKRDPCAGAVLSLAQTHRGRPQTTSTPLRTPVGGRGGTIPQLAGGGGQTSHQEGVSDSVRPHRRQPTRLPHPWDSPGKNARVGCHFLLQCMKVKSESEVAQSCPTLSDPILGKPGMPSFLSLSLPTQPPTMSMG